MTGMTGRTVIVTGGAAGIGAGIVESFCDRGAKVVIGDIDVETGRQFAERLGSAAAAVQLDVTDPMSCAATVEFATKWSGPVDVLVNNAGIPGSCPLPIENVSPQEWDRVFDVNVKGAFLMSAAVIPAFKQRASGKIVNVASRSAKVAIPEWTHYSASKFAMIGLTQGTALELASHGINVNAICPGDVLTPLQRTRLEKLAHAEGSDVDTAWNDYVKSAPIAMGRPQTARDMGELAVFLCSDAAANITGQAINVTGGPPFH